MKSGKKRKLKKIILFFLLLIPVLFLWSLLIEPNILIVKKYRIENEKLRGIRAVFAGDFHFRPYQGNRLNYTVKKINAQNADIILFIGDYVNRHSIDTSYPMTEIAKKLAEIKPSKKIFTVLGNHDCYQDKKKIKKELVNAGVEVLENSTRYVRVKDRLISVSGIEDLTTGFPNVEKTLRLSISPTILLTHQPDIFYKIPQKVDLILAGHTHGGQVRIPFFGPVFVPSVYGTRFAYGLIKEEGKKMIVTNGIGTSILPIRFNCFPEIVVIDFI